MGFTCITILESVADLIGDGTYVAEDTIRVFGQAWSMIGDEPSLAGLFTEQESNQKSEHSNAEEQESADSITNSITEQPTTVESVEAEDVSLDFDEVSDTGDSDLNLSEQEMSEIDPFSEGYSSDLEGAGQEVDFPDVIDESLDADFFAGALEEEEPPTVEEDDSDDFVIEDVPFDDNDSFDELIEEHTVEATADVDQAIVNEFTEDVTRVVSRDTVGFDEPPLDIQSDSAELAGFDDDFEDIDDEFAVEAIAANLWEELEDSEEDLQESASKQEKFPDVEKNLQSTKSALLPGTDVSTSVFQESNTSTHTSFGDDAVVPQMEVEEGAGEESDSTPSSSEAVKPKQRLSFSNKVPEVKKVKKREINGLHAFAIIVLFCIVVIAGTWWKSNKDKQEFAGLETNSNVLKPATEEQKGLRESDKEDGQAPENDTIQEGDADPSMDPMTKSGDMSETTSTEGFQDPYPQVLPDVPEESIDFANDKSSRELTREGYRALKDGNPDKAIKLFQLALEKDKGFADAVMGLGKSYQKRGEIDQAKEAFCRHAIYHQRVSHRIRWLRT